MANSNKLAKYLYAVIANEGNIVQPRSVPNYDRIRPVLLQIIEETDLGDPVPVTPESLARFPQEYLPFLFSVLRSLEEYNTHQLELAEEVQPAATRRWAFQLLSTLPHYGRMRKSLRSTLARMIVNCVNNDVLFRGYHLISPPVFTAEDYVLINEAIIAAAGQVRRSRRYINDMEQHGRSRIRRDTCFLPEASTVACLRRLFNIVPQSKMTRRFVTIDIQTLQVMLREANRRFR